jgi:hypothetical protein
VVPTTTTKPLTLEPERDGIEESHDAFSYRWTLVRVLAIHGLAELAGAFQFSASE